MLNRRSAELTGESERSRHFLRSAPRSHPVLLDAAVPLSGSVQTSRQTGAFQGGVLEHSGPDENGSRDQF